MSHQHQHQHPHRPTLLALRRALDAVLDGPTWDGSAAPAAAAGRSASVVTGRDIGRVQYPGLPTYWLPKPQCRVVRALADAQIESDCPDIDQGHLLRVAAVPGARRLADVFAGSRAWGTLVVPGRAPGSYRLAPMPGDEEAEGDDRPDDAA